METTNNLKFKFQTTTKRKEVIIIEIRLNDECKNGHNDFAITADIYKPNTAVFSDRNWLSGGCQHGEILKAAPQFKPFVDLHLCDAKGAPMYAESNGFYHLKNSSKEVVLNYLRIAEHEYNVLATAEDQTVFTYLLDNVLNVPARWAIEANEAIKQLEALTGKNFKDDSVRYQFTPLAANVVADIEAKINAGYYTADNIKERYVQKLADAKQKTIEALTADRDKGLKKHNDEFNVKLTILNAGLPLDNFIFYNHTNTGVFNWKSYDKKITDEQFNTFLADTDFSHLQIPGLTFKIGEDK